MKPSPLQLKWVSYPAVSYEVVEAYESTSDESEAVPVDVRVEVNWETDGEHVASLYLHNRENEITPYKFSVAVMGVFVFDLDLATKTYNPATPWKLAGIVAANIARILFGGAREHIAMLTARGPYGPLQIESVLIEPSDVSLNSSVAPNEILRDIFRVPIKELEKLDKQYAEHLKELESETEKVPKDRQKKSL